MDKMIEDLKKLKGNNLLLQYGDTTCIVGKLLEISVPSNLLRVETKGEIYPASIRGLKKIVALSKDEEFNLFSKNDVDKIIEKEVESKDWLSICPYSDKIERVLYSDDKRNFQFFREEVFFETSPFPWKLKKAIKQRGFNYYNEISPAYRIEESEEHYFFIAGLKIFLKPLYERKELEKILEVLEIFANLNL